MNERDAAYPSETDHSCWYKLPQQNATEDQSHQSQHLHNEADWGRPAQNLAAVLAGADSHMTQDG